MANDPNDGARASQQLFKTPFLKEIFFPLSFPKVLGLLARSGHLLHPMYDPPPPPFFLLKYNYLTATWVFLNIFSPTLHCWATKRSSTTPSLIHPDLPFSLPVFLTFFLAKDCHYECAKFWEDFGGVRGWHSRLLDCTLNV